MAQKPTAKLSPNFRLQIIQDGENSAGQFCGRLPPKPAEVKKKFRLTAENFSGLWVPPRRLLSQIVLVIRKSFPQFFHRFPTIGQGRPPFSHCFSTDYPQKIRVLCPPAFGGRAGFLRGMYRLCITYVSPLKNQGVLFVFFFD